MKKEKKKRNPRLNRVLSYPTRLSLSLSLTTTLFYLSDPKIPTNLAN